MQHTKCLSFHMHSFIFHSSFRPLVNASDVRIRLRIAPHPQLPPSLFGVKMIKHALLHDNQQMMSSSHLHIIEYSQAEVCSGTVAEVIQSVVNGADGCIFCFGHADLGQCCCLKALKTFLKALHAISHRVFLNMFKFIPVILYPVKMIYTL